MDLRNKKGKFIVFEGPDGCGKTTQVNRLVETLRSKGIRAFATRDLGGTEVGAKMREVFLTTKGHFSAKAQILMILAARAQHVEEVILPRLEKGDVVVCDRFTATSMAFQGYMENLGVDLIEELSLWASDSLTPDVTIFMDNHHDTAHKWMSERGELDRMESLDPEYKELIRAGFDMVFKKIPVNKRIKVPTGKNIEDTSAYINQKLVEIFGFKLPRKVRKEGSSDDSLKFGEEQAP